MPNFTRANAKLTCKYKDKATHGGNHAPSPADWFKSDDTLDRQGVSPGRPNGHGICKGTASSWVIAFLSGERAASDASLYEKYYTDFLRYQATMVKDFGGHIPNHLKQLKKIGVDTDLREHNTFKKKDFELRDGHLHAPWAVYCSVWHHDIAFGSLHGSSGPFYICEPNTGLLGYSSAKDFLADLNDYISSRRTRKGLAATAEAGFWVYI